MHTTRVISKCSHWLASLSGGKSGNPWLYASLALSVAWCWPLASVYWFETDEKAEYVTRTVEYAAALARGDLYPRWCPDFYAGYGSPFFHYYAPAVYWLGGAFTLVLGTPVLALKLIILIAGLVAAAFSFAVVRLETGRSDAAFLAACLYIAAPYRLSEVSWRGDLAELFALSMLPVAAFAYLRIVHEFETRHLPRLTVAAAAAHAGLVLSHTLIALWGTALLFVLIVLSTLRLTRRGDLARARFLALSFCVGLLASSFYTGPALLEKHLVRTEVMYQGIFAPQNNMLTLAHLFRPGPFYIGPLLIAALSLLLFGSLYRQRLQKPSLAWLGGGIVLTALTLPIAAPLWASRLIPFGSYIQFPWRLLGPASLCFALAFGIAWAHAFPSRLVSGLLSLYVVAGAVQLSMPRSSVSPMAVDRVLLSPERIRDTMVRGTILDEYLPRVVGHVDYLAKRQLAVGSDALQVRIEESAGTAHVLSIHALAAHDLELKLHSFPGWRVRTLSGEPVSLGETARGLLSLRVPAPGHYRVLVEFASTPLRSTFLALSLAALLCVFPLALLLARQKAADVELPRSQVVVEHD
jgi:hypothetical protein